MSLAITQSDTYASFDPERLDHVIFIGMSGHVSEVDFGTGMDFGVINDLTKLAGSSTTVAAESPVNGDLDTLYRHHVN